MWFHPAVPFHFYASNSASMKPSMLTLLSSLKAVLWEENIGHQDDEITCLTVSECRPVVPAIVATSNRSSFSLHARNGESTWGCYDKKSREIIKCSEVQDKGVKF